MRVCLLSTCLELIDGGERVDARHAAVLEPEECRAVVTGAVTWRLTNENKVWPERTAALLA